MQLTTLLPLFWSYTVMDGLIRRRFSGFPCYPKMRSNQPHYVYGLELEVRHAETPFKQKLFDHLDFFPLGVL